ncbi:hypothetical protein Tco_1276481 [Tanacetum coccineum]
MDNIADPLMKGLSRELVRESSKGMRLKPLKEWVSMKENQTQLTGDPKIWAVLFSPTIQLTVSAVVPWETDGESVLREACQTRVSAL